MRQKNTQALPAVHNLPANHGILQYRGGKAYLAEEIVSLMPRHDRYIEPFFGAGHVYFHKMPCAYEVINDINREVAIFFQILRDQPTDLIAQLWATPYSRQEYIESLEEGDNRPLLQIAREFFIQCNMGFAGLARSVGNFGTGNNVCRGMPESVSKYQSKITMLATYAKRLRNAMIENQDYRKVIARYLVPGQRTLIYADPPYLPNTRVSQNLYKFEMTEFQHIEMLEYLDSIDAMIMLSGYPSALYTKHLKGWDCVKWDVSCHSIGGTTEMLKAGHKKSRRTECLWRNPKLMESYAKQLDLWSHN